MATTQPAAESSSEAHVVEGHDHPSFLAHHFETPEQQHDSGKLGMWLFLATEVLFFGGLFCAYALYRMKHPEVFQYAHQFLDVKWGALNTGVLIFSSFTMAWAVRNAQLGERKKLITNLLITLACAFVFLGVKYVEYSHKFHDGLLWAGSFTADEHFAAMDSGGEAGSDHGEASADDHGGTMADAEHGGGDHGGGHVPEGEMPRYTSIFFSIYFGMTGLHAIHVIAGIIAISWILRRAIRGDFNPQYYGAVDNVGLYWHIVDLVWIYLFPMLYLLK